MYDQEYGSFGVYKGAVSYALHEECRKAMAWAEGIFHLLADADDVADQSPESFLAAAKQLIDDMEPDDTASRLLKLESACRDADFEPADPEKRNWLDKVAKITCKLSSRMREHLIGGEKLHTFLTEWCETDYAAEPGVGLADCALKFY